MPTAHPRAAGHLKRRQRSLAPGPTATPPLPAKATGRSARWSISRVLSAALCRGWPFIWDVRHRTPRATYPDGGAETHLALRPTVPIRSCSRWGLPCRPRCRGRGALLPHPFTLTGPRPAVCFLWHFPWGRPRRVLPGTVFPWSPDFPPPRPEDAKATIRPSGSSGCRRRASEGQRAPPQPGSHCFHQDP